MGTRVPTINVLSKATKNIKNFPMKFSIFTTEKILCILHGQGFVITADVIDSSCRPVMLNLNNFSGETI